MVNDKVSIVICFKNRPVIHAKNFLESLTYQTIKPYEVIFSDCGSKPEIRDALEEVCKQYSAIHLYLPQPTGSPHESIFGGIPKIIPVQPLDILHETGKARNYGVKQATGDIVMISQTDLIFNSYVVEAIVEAHNFYKRKGKRSFIMGRIRLLQKRQVKPEDIKLPDDFEKLWLGSKRRGGRAVQSSQRSWWFEVQGYDERMRYNADLDLEKRARMSKLPVAFINGFKNYLTALKVEPKILHQWHQNSVLVYKRSSPIFHLLMRRRHIERRDNTIVRNKNGWGEPPIW